MTEGDKIRSMNDIQLAAFLVQYEIDILNEIADKFDLDRPSFSGYEIALTEAKWVKRLKQKADE